MRGTSIFRMMNAHGTKRSMLCAVTAGKHGQVGLVRQLADELREFGITVDSVAPGFMATSPDYQRRWDNYTEETRRRLAERIAMRRMGTPRDVADAVLFLASGRASWTLARYTR